MAQTARPEDVEAIESVYGPPGRSSIGSAVFHEAHPNSWESLHERALEKYKQFNGPSWERFGAEAWLSSWGELYVRSTEARPDIVTELRSIADPQAASVVSQFLDAITEPEKAAQTLSASLDRPDVVELRVFRIGDGAAISGLLIASRRTTGDDLFLVFQYD